MRRCGRWGAISSMPYSAARCCIEAVAVVGLIADQTGGSVFDEPRGERSVDERDFMRRSAGHVNGDRKTMAVANRHDLAALTASSRADGGAPFFAELKLASMKASLRSSFPRSRRSSARRCNTRSNGRCAASAGIDDGRFGTADIVSADRATAHRCAAPTACRSAPRAYRSTADHVRRRVDEVGTSVRGSAIGRQ